MKSEWKTGLKAGTTADNFLKKSLSSNYFTYQQIFEMLVPLIMDQFFVSIIGLLTTAMISSSSQESVSAVSLVSPIYAMTYAIFSSISAAGTVIIAQYKGNGNMNMVKKAAGQIVMFTVVSAIFFSIVLSFFAGSLIDAMFADADICVRIFDWMCNFLHFPFAIYGMCSSVQGDWSDKNMFKIINDY